VREGRPVPIGERVAVVGAGDTAMDCARTARRLGAEVTIVYRRTIDQMPADREEVRAMLEEQDPGPQALADALLTEAVRLDDGRPADDISVLVLKVVKRAGDEVRRMTVRLPIRGDAA